MALAESLPSFSLGVDRVAKRHRYTGCKVNRATFAGTQGGLLRLTLDVVGQAETADAASWPSLTPDASQGPFIFSDLALTLNATAREVRDFELVIDNGLVTDRFMNSTTVVNLPEGDRHVTLRTTHAFAAANLDLYDQALSGAGGTLAMTSTQGTPSVLTFTFGDLQVPAEPAGVDGRAEIFLTLPMVARKTGGTLELAANIVVLTPEQSNPWKNNRIMRNDPIFIDDGYTARAYVEAVPGLHARCTSSTGRCLARNAASKPS